MKTINFGRFLSELFQRVNATVDGFLETMSLQKDATTIGKNALNVSDYFMVIIYEDCFCWMDF